MEKSFVIDIGKENRIIRGDVSIPHMEKALPVIILVHGFKGFKDWGFFPTLAKKLCESGFGVIRFNFSMCGVGEDLENYTELDKFAHLTYTREQEDLSIILEYLIHDRLPLSTYLDKERIGLFGHSRGGGNSILFALDNGTIKAVTIWNSIYRVNFFDSKLIEEIEENGIGYISNARTGDKMPIHKEVLEDIEENKEKYNILEKLPNLSSPLLILQGTNDHPALVEGALKLRDTSSFSIYKEIEGADHTMRITHPYKETTPHFEIAIEHTISFYQKHL